MIERLLQDLSQTRQALADVPDNRGKFQGLQLGVCQDNQDPQEMARVRVKLAQGGGLTDWLYCCLPFRDLSLPVPQPGDTLVVGFLNGDPHRGFYLGVLQNQVNPARDPLHWDAEVGDSKVQVTPDRYWYKNGPSELEVTEDRLEYRNGTSELDVDDTRLEYRVGQATFRIDALAARYDKGIFDWEIRLGTSGAEIHWTNVEDFTINGQSVLVVGSTDSDGDTNVTRGY